MVSVSMMFSRCVAKMKASPQLPNDKLVTAGLDGVSDG